MSRLNLNYITRNSIIIMCSLTRYIYIYTHTRRRLNGFYSVTYMPTLSKDLCIHIRTDIFFSFLLRENNGINEQNGNMSVWIDSGEIDLVNDKKQNTTIITPSLKVHNKKKKKWLVVGDGFGKRRGWPIRKK